MRPRDRLSGFTLIELIIVLVLLSVITALVAPRLTRSLGRMNAESAAREIASAFRFGRSLAVTEKVPYRVVIDMITNTLTLSPYRSPDETRDEIGDVTESADTEGARLMEPRVYVLADGIRFREAVSLNGETVTSGTFQMTFFPGGGSSGGEIVIGDDEGRSFSVALDIITGSAGISEKGTTDD